ncbi:P-loop containing nucleoside triphosphate hydrolase protein [Rhypophila decipiens]|uniref:P-loop containing nucleoside triphosphate hydrolase protein n=1 Tax=Rhypophila decipiens TaxID=261697 RepID=A0AAN6YE16_9PEZI|nr:P-loop containing nucleoside triphosphate hydrolase protein [Rhypophila decipiens]
MYQDLNGFPSNFTSHPSASPQPNHQARRTAAMGKAKKEAKVDLADNIAKKTAGFIQSDEHRDLLDIVDTLRSQGVSHYVDLPQIIVCGSQSSGKSSTLEALSGIEFPSAEGLCTRFATELVLRRGDVAGIKVHIQPHADRTEEERINLSRFSMEASDAKPFPKIIEEAKQAMGLSAVGVAGAKIFSTDVLRIESTSPTAPNLTLVDLPGLFGAADKNQSDDDAALVQDMVTNYMRQRRSIILAVVTADNPFANQPVTKFAREIDPQGQRTLGLITKPDKIDKGSDSERYYIELAQNQNVKLNLGWHVLRNRSHATADDSAEERDERENDFFANSLWGESLAKTQLGVDALRERLRNVLWNQINNGLPGVISDVQAGIKDCENKLAQLGKARISSREKHSYLHKISARLSVLLRAAIDGVYSDQFFEPGSEDSSELLERRLRARVQSILSDYADRMREDGHALEIVEDDDEAVRDNDSGRIDRYDYLTDHVKPAMFHSRGRELPGTFNPLVVGDLFSQQCRPWERITHRVVEEIHKAAAETFREALDDICDSNTADRLRKYHITPALHQLRKDLKEKIDELLLPHQSIHPITYNDYLCRTVNKIQTERMNRKVEAVASTTLQVQKSAEHTWYTASSVKLFKAGIKAQFAPDVEEYSASLAADVAAAYYQIALEKFIDDVSVNAIETCLIQALPEVLSPQKVWDLDEDTVELLGSETDETIAERTSLTLKLETLTKGLHDLDGFTSSRPLQGGGYLLKRDKERKVPVRDVTRFAQRLAEDREMREKASQK